MQTYQPELSEILSSFGGLEQIHSGYDALSWLLENASDEHTKTEGIAFILALLNERLASQMKAMQQLLDESKGGVA